MMQRADIHAPAPWCGFWGLVRAATGRLAVCGLLALAVQATTSIAGHAQGASLAGGDGVLRGTVRQGSIDPIPVAIPVFIGNDPRLSAQIADVIKADLAGSGLFEVLDQGSYLERIQDVNRAPRFPDWRAIKADALVVGRVSRTPEGRVATEFRLWDVATGRQLSGQRFGTSDANMRRIGHIIADQVYERLTGEKGYFDTRVVFVDETGSKRQRVKRLAIMDQDGFNVRLLSKSGELVLTPRFSPTRQEITFMSYAGGQPRVYLMNLETGQRQVVGDFPNMTFAPRFSPDGERIVMSLQEGGGSSIFEMDLRSKRKRRLTDAGRSIDTGPSYAPDGKQIVFESDRQGTQQLYVIPANGGAPRRISFGKGRYSTPVWSPRGDYIAFTKQLMGRFLIGVMNPDGSGERILSEGFHNEGPTWAPNGRVLMFFRESRGNGGPKIHSVDITGYNERMVRTPSFASDPAWSPLLN